VRRNAVRRRTDQGIYSIAVRSPERAGGETRERPSAEVGMTCSALLSGICLVYPLTYIDKGK